MKNVPYTKFIEKNLRINKIKFFGIPCLISRLNRPNWFTLLLSLEYRTLSL